MARASSIWVVREGTRPVAAFTVKHELGRWLTRQEPGYLDEIDVWRLRDAQPGEPVVKMSAQRILDEARAAVLR